MAASSGGIVGSAQTDITNPYETIPCGCVYCFVCIAQKLEAEEGEGWICLRCGELVKQCKPWNGDVLEEAPRPSGTGKNVGFAVSADTDADSQAPEKLSDATAHKGTTLLDTDGALQDSSQWSPVERESSDEAAADS